jgi:phage major head subunit gpT-like protein
MLVNNANLSVMYQNFQIIFGNAFKDVPKDWDKIAMRVPSNTGQEVYPWLGATTRFREWIGDRVMQNLMASQFTIKNKPWENTITINRDQIEDDLYGIFNPMVAQLGQDAAQHPDELIFNLLKNGFTNLCYDGQYFFDIDHPILNADGTYGITSNFNGGAGTAWYLLDTSKVIKPLIYQVRKDYNFVAMDGEKDDNVFSRREFVYGVDARSNVGYGLWQLAQASRQTLDETNYNNARTALMSRIGDNGKPLGLRSTLLVVPPSLEGAARKLLQADAAANGATNVYKGTADLLVTPWLA